MTTLESKKIKFDENIKKYWEPELQTSYKQKNKSLESTTYRHETIEWE